MSLALLWPAGLAALAAVLLPLLIHLARRSETRPIEFAALRWLRSVPRPRRRIRFDEWPLLLLRLLLLVALALLLAAPVLRGREDTRPRIAIAPAITLAEARKALGAEAFDPPLAVWLAPGFADAATSPAPTSPTPQASLLRELDAQLPAGAPLTVVVPAIWGDVDAQRPRLSRAVRWVVVPGRSPATSANATSAPPLVVYAADTQHPALRYLQALQRAWHPQAPWSLRAIDDHTALPAGAFVVWLSPSAPDTAVLRHVADGAALLLDPRTPWPDGATPQPRWYDVHDAVILEAATWGRGQLLRFTRPMTADGLPLLDDGDFPRRLLDLVQPVPAPRQAAASMLEPLHDASLHWPQPAEPLAPWLIWLVALLFLIERWLGTARRRGQR